MKSIDLTSVPAGMLDEQRAFLADNRDLLTPLTVDANYLATVRAAWEAEPEPTDPTARDEEIDGVIVRVFEHPNPAGTVVHAHGGGWVACHNDMWDGWLGQVRDIARATVVSIEYRRPPEHAWPAPIDDIETVIANVAAHADTPILVLGESAGANLIAGTLVRLNRESSPALLQIVGAGFTYGAFDLTGGLPSHHRPAGHGELVLGQDQLRWHPSAYAGDAELTHPEISPLYASVPDSIPAVFTAGSADPLLDDTILMAYHWRLAGNPTNLSIYPDATHAFDEFPGATGQHARRAIATWLAARLDDHGSERW